MGAMSSGYRLKAVVIGAGIGGLAVTAGLCAAGWDVRDGLVRVTGG